MTLIGRCQLVVLMVEITDDRSWVMRLASCHTLTLGVLNGRPMFLERIVLILGIDFLLNMGENLVLSYDLGGLYQFLVHSDSLFLVNLRLHTQHFL